MTAPYTPDLVIQFAVVISAMDRVAMNARAARKTHIETKMDFANVLGSGREKTAQHGQGPVVTDDWDVEDHIHPIVKHV